MAPCPEDQQGEEEGRHGGRRQGEGPSHVLEDGAVYVLRLLWGISASSTERKG